MTKLARPLAFVLMTATMATGSAVFAQDTLRLTVGQRGLWDTSISDVGQRAGIFKKHGAGCGLPSSICRGSAPQR